MADYFSFEDVMGELQIDEDELKRMVSEGELRAFRSENKMKFKAEDVENLRKGRVSEPTVILPSAPTPPKGTPAVPEAPLELDLGMDVEEKRPTEELLPASKTQHGEEPLALEDVEINTEAVSAPSDTVAEEEVGTEPLSVSGDTEVSPAVGEETVVEGVQEGPPRRQARRAVVPGQMPAFVETQIEQRRAHWVWTLIMSCALLASLAYGIVLYDVLRFNTGKIDKPSQLTDGSVRYILSNYYWSDEHWRNQAKERMPKGPNGNYVMPPFTSTIHRDYDQISYEEPDKALPQEEVDKIREEIRRKHGEQAPAKGGTQ